MLQEDAYSRKAPSLTLSITTAMVGIAAGLRGMTLGLLVRLIQHFA
jgi:hypothetical protein